MKKIYFAPTEWADSAALLNCFKYQTPKNDGIWCDLVGVTNLQEADYIIIQDKTTIKEKLKNFSKEQLIYFSREALDSSSIKEYPQDEFTHFSYWNGTGYLFTRWIYNNSNYSGLGKSYGELINSDIPKKNLEICSILSNKEICAGHSLRKLFAKNFLSKFPLHLYGNIEFNTHSLVNNDKYNTLIKYKYCLGFDNQDHINNFFGTQFTDSILAECCPIFWCGTDLSKFFPEKSFIQLDIRMPNEVERVVEIISNEDFEKRIPDIKEAKNLILNKYNIWPTIKNIIK